MADKKNEKSGKAGQLKGGDFIVIDFTGKVKSTGKVFDSTNVDKAKEAGIFNERAPYKPQLIVFGTGQLIAGLEEGIGSMAVGEEKEIEVQPEKAFGQKDPNSVRVMPLADFAAQNIKPAPGMVLNFGNANALVRSVSSGRVVLDFNHPLAGETLLYSVKLASVISGTKEKVAALADSLGFGQGMEIKVVESSLELKFAAANTSNEFISRKKSMLDAIGTYLPEIKEVRVSEEYKKLEQPPQQAPQAAAAKTPKK